MKTYCIYTALIYTNYKYHIGHLYELIIANILYNYIKIWYKTKLIAGTDDHGLKIESRGKILNVSPEKITNINTNKLLAITTKFRIPIKEWIRTSKIRNIKLTINKFKNLIRIKKWVYKLCYCGWYSPIDDVFCCDDNISFSNNNMYVWNNQPVEWVEEEGLFLDYNKLRRKIMAIYRAKIIRTPNIKDSTVYKIVNDAKSVCITRKKSTDYGLKFKTLNNNKFVLWVWIDALIAYINSNGKNKIHIIGKDIINFHLTYYIAMALILNVKLPKIIYLHHHIKCKSTKVSKRLNNRLIAFENLPKSVIYYILCSKSNKTDIEINQFETAKSSSGLIKNIGNLVKRLSKLINLNGIKLQQLTTSDWISLIYIKHIDKIVKHNLYLFKFNAIIKTLLRQSSRVNTKISNYKLWYNKNVKHKLYIYSHVTSFILFWFKPIIGKNSDVMIKNMFCGNWRYLPFKNNYNTNKQLMFLS